LYGYGVDEVLQLEMEMVLADGTHMKFGPQNGSKGGPGLLYPQTTRVEGKCNARAHNEDCEWAWQACDKDAPFESLWRAVEVTVAALTAS
jgi:hypothetical protein